VTRWTQYRAAIADWIYFLHAPRENFAATLTNAEAAVFDEHLARFQRLCADGVVVLAGPTLGATNTGICVFHAEDELAAQRILDDDPVIVAGICTGELRPYMISVLAPATA
jgi:uncharacterized protein YciI